MHLCVQVHTHVCVQAHEGQRSTLAVVLQMPCIEFCYCFIETDYLTGLELFTWAKVG